VVSRRTTLLVGWTLAVLGITLFVSLGLWQSRCAVEKQAMLDASARVVTARRVQAPAIAFDAARARAYDWTNVQGTFAAAPPLLLDNQQRDGRVGVRVFRLFQPVTGGEWLVDLGWLPLSGARALPELGPAPTTPTTLRGLLAPPPSSGLRLGAPMAQQGDAWLLARVDLAAIDRAPGDPARPLAPRVLRLDPAQPIGYARDLDVLPNTLLPAQHRGYAVQWFGLALTVLAIALLLTFRRPRP